MLNGVECVPATKVHGSNDDPELVIGQPSGTVAAHLDTGTGAPALGSIQDKDFGVESQSPSHPCPTGRRGIILVQKYWT